MTQEKRNPWNPLLCSYPDSKKINSVSFEAETLFTRLLAKCDDRANFDGDSSLILCKLFAERMKNHQVSKRKIAKWLEELKKNGLILQYCVNGSTYIHIKSCKKHLRKDYKPDWRFPDNVGVNGDIPVPPDTETERKPSGNRAETGTDPCTTTTTTTTATTTYSPNSEELRLSTLLLTLILQRKPDCKKPNLQQWAKEIDLMIRCDNRQVKTIEAVIRWVQQDAFEQVNVLSTSKLRKRFDNLEMKMEQSNGNRNDKTQRQQPPRDYDGQVSKYGQTI